VSFLVKTETSNMIMMYTQLDSTKSQRGHAINKRRFKFKVSSLF